MSACVCKKYRIQGMHCPACAMTIDFDLEDTAGVVSAKTSYVKQTCEVKFDPQKISEQKIKQAIKKAGYGVGGKL